MPLSVPDPAVSVKVRFCPARRDTDYRCRYRGALSTQIGLMSFTMSPFASTQLPVICPLSISRRDAGSLPAFHMLLHISRESRRQKYVYRATASARALATVRLRP